MAASSFALWAPSLAPAPGARSAKEGTRCSGAHLHYACGYDEVLPSMVIREAFPGQVSRTRSTKAAAKSAGLIRFIWIVSQRGSGMRCSSRQMPANEVEVRRTSRRRRPRSRHSLLWCHSRHEDIVEAVAEPPHVAPILHHAEVLDQSQKAQGGPRWADRSIKCSSVHRTAVALSAARNDG